MNKNKYSCNNSYLVLLRYSFNMAVVEWEYHLLITSDVYLQWTEIPMQSNPSLKWHIIFFVVIWFLWLDIFPCFSRVECCGCMLGTLEWVRILSLLESFYFSFFCRLHSSLKKASTYTNVKASRFAVASNADSNNSD